MAAGDSAERDTWMSDKPSVDPRLAANALAQLRREMFGQAAAPVRLGRYEIESRIGAGGMGTVYEALDPALGRRGAIKLLRRESAAEEDPDAGRARLRREAMALAMLSHPNVVTIHDVGEADGALFIATERVEGANLSAWLAAQPREVGEILEVFGQAARGLIAAHESGLVHRDFKPANVLVGRDGRVRVADFGIAAPSVPAAATEERASTTTSRSLVLTQTLGSTLGTPAYMAPEQHRGAAATHRSDQYSFALTLYEALCGTPPFRAADERELFECKLMRRFAVELPDRVADKIRDALHRALSNAPSDRFEDMASLLRELSAAPGSAAPHRSWARRVVWPAIVVASAALVAVWISSRADGSPGEPTHAVAPAPDPEPAPAPAPALRRRRLWARRRAAFDRAAERRHARRNRTRRAPAVDREDARALAASDEQAAALRIDDSTEPASRSSASALALPPAGSRSWSSRSSRRRASRMARSASSMRAVDRCVRCTRRAGHWSASPPHRSSAARSDSRSPAGHDAADGRDHERAAGPT